MPPQRHRSIERIDECQRHRNHAHKEIGARQIALSAECFRVTGKEHVHVALRRHRHRQPHRAKAEHVGEVGLMEPKGRMG